MLQDYLPDARRPPDPDKLSVDADLPADLFNNNNENNNVNNNER